MEDPTNTKFNMPKTTRKLPLVLASLFGLSGAGVFADSVNPLSVSTTLAAGECLTFDATVTVDAETPTSSKVDVFFLADNTRDMGGYINAVKAAASDILSDTGSLGDLAFGVGRYVDEIGDMSYQLIQSITSSQPAALAGINDWYASGGGDLAEANLYGLYRAASDPATDWRTGSERILVWFGNAPGHDPSPGGPTPTGGKVTKADTIAALQAAGINVQAVDLGNMYSGLDSSDNQATDITTATGGDLYPFIHVDPIIDTIKDAIAPTVSTYTTVDLDLSDVPAGVTATTIPSEYTGDFDRSIARDFTFEVTVCNDAGGDHSFDLYATVDGDRVALANIEIADAGTPTVPDGGSTALLLAAALVGMGGLKPLGRLRGKS